MQQRSVNAADYGLNRNIILLSNLHKYCIALVEFVTGRFTDYFVHVQLLATIIFYDLAEYANSAIS